VKLTYFTRPGKTSSFRQEGVPVRALAGAMLVLLLVAGGARAQQAAPADSLATAPADTLATAPADTLAAAATDSAAAGGDGPGLSAAELAAAQRAERAGSTPFISSFTNAVTAGTKSDVRVNKYYGDLETVLAMEGSSRFSNTLGYSWDDYRQQDKTIEARSTKATYTAGNLLPVSLTANGSWDWSEDRTINYAGLSNLSKRDLRNGSVRLSRSKFDVGILRAIVNTSAGINDQKSINQNQANDFSEAYLDGGAQVGTQITRGVTVASRIYGKTVDGDRTLGNSTSPSSATGDTVGVGMYFKRGLANGRFAISRSNFDRKFLDYKRNSTGQIDTVGLDEFDKVVDELETKDAVSIEFENELRVGRFGLATELSRDTDQLDYQQSGVGLKERQSDEAFVALTFGTGRDSFAISYSYLWKWDDQRIKNATENRGRQYTKNRDLDFFYGRRIFTATFLSLKLHQGLGQDIAQNGFNTNDKDRLRNDLVLELDRNWTNKFKVNMLFAFKQSDEIAIHTTRSSNNNIKDSFEVSPGFTWPVSDWLTLSQSYRVYIQYTDYYYSDLESVNRSDNYNKRGNLNTIVVLNPTERLELAIRHDYNKRSNATRTVTDASGTSYYHTDQKQAINKIDFGAVFKVVPGVTLEAATFRTRDFKETFGTTTRETEVYSGEVWVGAKVNRKWGKNNPLELSALVKKYNAFGPSVTEASSDYWEADVWLKWEF
jgi:hypothetical protein